MSNIFGGIYSGKRVFITGHTGFKGSWLALWLVKMGAKVKGFSLAPEINPNHWELLQLGIESFYGDIKDFQILEAEIENFQPEIIFHLAAQAIVLRSYEDPVATYETNVIGTIKLLQACRKVDSVRAIINVTSDKCYDNREWVYGYREIDAMGGYDPYSSSKGCSELLTSSFRKSYWNIDKYEVEHNVLLASCRAGNAIGGGDWSHDRLIPDMIKAASRGDEVIIRNPNATRPWQHVLDPLSGYLLVGQMLLERKKSFAKAWNFGPTAEWCLCVKDVIRAIQEFMPEIKVSFSNASTPHEASSLKLDCSQANNELKWRPVWINDKIFGETAKWYKDFITSGAIRSSEQIDEYVTDARRQRIDWAI